MKIQALDCEFVPARDGSRQRLLVVLHGRGDSSAGFRWLPEAMEFAGLSYLLVNAPDPYFGGRSWYGFPPDQSGGVVRSRGLLHDVFGEVLAAGWQAPDIGLLGFSQGCLMTLEFGARCAWPLACYVGISGHCHDPEKLLGDLHPSARRKVWLWTHGRSDEVLSFARSEQQAGVLQAGGLPLQFRAYDKGHTVDLDSELGDIRNFLGEHLRLAQA